MSATRGDSNGFNSSLNADSASADVELPLKYLSIGLWKKRRGPNASLSVLVLHSSQRFVFLLDKTAAPKAMRQGIKRVFRHLTAHSPFQSTGGVLAFEVDWKNVVGIDYSNPLCLSGRLVLESHLVVKRDFPSMKDMRSFYVPLLQPEPMPLFATPPVIELEARPPPGSADPLVENPFCVTSERPFSAQMLSPSVRPPEKFRRTGETVAEQEAAPGGEVTPPQLPWTHVEAPFSRSVTPERSHSKKRKASGELPRLAMLESPVRLPATYSGKDIHSRGGSLQQWPAPSCWTVPSSEFEYRSITMNFDHPCVPEALRPVIQSDERLLKLYESGLPGWAIYAPQYGVWYRPWMRRITYMLFVLVSAFSLVMGFYDLYKNVPYLDKILRQFGSMYLPSTAVLEWLDHHVSFRLSILFAYLFGKSELAVQLVRWLGTAAAFCKAALQPVTSIIGPPLALWARVFSQYWSQVAGAGVAAWQLTCTITGAIFGPPFVALLEMMVFIYHSCLPVLQATGSIALSILLGPFNFAQFVAATFNLSAAAFLNLVHVLCRVAASCWQALRAGSNFAPAVAGSAKEVGSQVSVLYFLVRLEALEVVKNSAVKTIKALQTLARLLNQVVSDIARHRLTLQIRLRRRWMRVKARMRRTIPAWAVTFWGWVHQNWSSQKGVADPEGEEDGAGSSGTVFDRVGSQGLVGGLHSRTGQPDLQERRSG